MPNARRFFSENFTDNRRFFQEYLWTEAFRAYDAQDIDAFRAILAQLRRLKTRT